MYPYKHLKIRFLFILIFFVIDQAVANVDYQDDPFNGIIKMRVIRITGVITKDDVPKVEALMKVKEGGVKFLLNSPGGDLEAALKIGDLIYRADYGKEVEINGSKIYYKAPPLVNIGESLASVQGLCASACVAIYASAISRDNLIVFPEHKLVVHSPYMTDRSMSYDEIRATNEKLKETFVRQVTRAGVSERLWELMMSTPSERARTLSQKELVDLGLSNSDPAFIDFQNGVRALREGIPKIEYLRRKAIYDDCMSKDGGEDSRFGSSVYERCLKRAKLSF